MPDHCVRFHVHKKKKKKIHTNTHGKPPADPFHASDAIEKRIDVEVITAPSTQTTHNRRSPVTDEAYKREAIAVHGQPSGGSGRTLAGTWAVVEPRMRLKSTPNAQIQAEFNRYDPVYHLNSVDMASKRNAHTYTRRDTSRFASLG